MENEWLEAFLVRKGRGDPDGRLLCRYECDQDEYLSLIESLQRVGDPGHLRQTFRYGLPIAEHALKGEDEHGTMPAFVLYASEWFGRDWNGGMNGVWKKLMNGVGWRADSYWELYPAMAAGLRWWGHCFITIIKTQYLGTFGYQSGRVKITGLRE